MERVAEANNWRTAQIYTIVVAYLKGAAANYYEEKCANINVWTNGNASNNLKDLLMAQFTSNSTKNIWYSDYLNCQQGTMESVKEYSNRFKKLQKKVNLNNGTPAANTIRQFLSGLNPVIALMVYASGPENLTAAVEIVKSIKAGYKII